MKNFLFINIFLFATFSIFAIPTDMTPFKITQPNGDSIIIIQRGDEYGVWYETLNGYVVDKNSSNYWVYVKVDSNGNLSLTNQVARNGSYTPIGININSVYSTIDNYRTNAYYTSNSDSLYYPDFEDIETAQEVEQGATLNISQIKAPAKNKGSINVLTILIQFQDVKFEQPIAVTQDYFYRLMNDENFTHPNNPSNATGSVKKYWEEASFGQLSINATIVGPYTAEYNIEEYKSKRNDDYSLNTDKTNKLIKEAIKSAAKDINLQLFDNDNNGYVDFVHIVYAGEMNNIWPHSSSINKSLKRDNVWISKYIITSEKEKDKYASIGTICHEMGHAFGAPDFYDRDESINGSFDGTGSWDLMASGCNNNAGNNPAHPNPYIKTMIYEWATAKELEGNDSLYTLRPAEIDSNSIYKLSTQTLNEYYLLENRQGDGLKSSGLIIYHVSSKIKTVDDDKINITHPQNLYVVVAGNKRNKPEGEGTYGKMSFEAAFKDSGVKNIYFTSESLPSNCDWNGDTTYNKDVCFISEEMIDGEKCIKFVLNPEIEGDDILCDSAIYSLKHIPSDATVEWTYIRPTSAPLGSTPLYIGSGQGTKNVYFKRGIMLGSDTDLEQPTYPWIPVMPTANYISTRPYQGFVTIKANVIFNGDTFSLSKEIYMPEKVMIDNVYTGPTDVWYTHTMKSMTLTKPTDETVLEDIRWYIEYPNGSTQTAHGGSVVVRPTTAGTLKVTATYINGCNDEYESQTRTYSIVSLFNMTFTNPASGSVDVNVTNGDASNESDVQTMSLNNQQTQYMGAYRLELWHDLYGKVREIDASENTPTVTMNLDGLNSGVYILRLIVDNQIVASEQMIVK